MRGALALGLAAAAGTAAGTASEMAETEPPTAEAIGGERAAMLMPFDGGGKIWLSGDGPGDHHVFWNAWSADLHAAPGTAVKPRLQTSDGNISMSVAGISNTCAAPNNAGKNVRVNVSVDGVHAGQVLYGHLDNVQVETGDEVTSGDALGYLKLWGQSSCWQDTLADGAVHTHVEVAKGCYRNLSPWTNHGGSTPFGMLSSEYSAGNTSVCDENDINQVMNSTPPPTQPPFVTHPSAVQRGNGMDVFYKEHDGDLANVGWNPGSGWRSPQDLMPEEDIELAGNPDAIARDTNNMEVAFVDTAGNLRTVGWNSAQDWGEAIIRASDVVGDPEIIERGNGMELFWRTEGGTLMTRGWNPTDGWMPPRDLATGIDSNPTAVARGTDSMDVFYRDGGKILNVGWDVNRDINGGWDNIPRERVVRNATGDPVVISRTPNDMDLFYRTTSNNLANKGWSAGTGWRPLTARASNVLSDPSATARGSGAMEVAFRSNNNTVWTVGWDANKSTNDGWFSPQGRGSGIYGEPHIINRGTSAMDVFYKQTDHLTDAGWNAGVGWGKTDIAGTSEIA